MKVHDMKVSDLMTTALVTINASEQLSEAKIDMEMSLVHHLPVVDDRGRLVGIVSDRDIVRRADKKRVSDVMSRDIVTTRPDAPAHLAASMMLEFRIGAVPVVDDDGALVGVVTITDYLALARRALLGLPLER
jgi:CBS domain-containing protein